MTFPPCFSTSSPRYNNNNDNININNSNSNSRSMLIGNMHRRQQQAPLFSPSVHALSPLPSTITTALRSATATATATATTTTAIPANENKEEGATNAARMLLELSHIVSKEISTDSGCMAIMSDKIKNRGRFFSDMTKTEDFYPSHEATVGSRSGTSSSGNYETSVFSKNTEIDSRHWGNNSNSNSSNNSRNTESNGFIPMVVTSDLRSSSPYGSYSSLLSSLPPTNSIEFASSTERMIGKNQNRHRTVSLGGDDIIRGHNLHHQNNNNNNNNNKYELSPLLFPLTAPSSPQASSLLFNNNTENPRHRPHFQHPLLFQQHELLEQQERENDAIRMVLSGVKTGAVSAALAAAVITPIPQHPRPVLSFPRSNSGNFSSNSSNSSNDDRQVHFPMELPPLLLNVKGEIKNSSSSVASRTYLKPSRRTTATTTTTTTTTAMNRGTASNKNNATTKSARSKKKTSATATAKKQQRQRHTGKKFSWKAYPELEDFLIANRQEYLSFSARNYTIEQRDYNNRLTARLLEHATASGYSTLFESCAFAAVRDRIRSYYKSYVQSFKRRQERHQQQQRQKQLDIQKRASSRNV